jgi:hypothetical protein
MCTFMLVFILLVTGICIVDYSVNNLLKNNNSIYIISAQLSETELVVNILNYKFSLNIRYINRDINRLQNYIRQIQF